jgi:hypothetical protein
MGFAIVGSREGIRVGKVDSEDSNALGGHVGCPLFGAVLIKGKKAWWWARIAYGWGDPNCSRKVKGKESGAGL